MQTQRMQRVYELFHEISSLPEAERLDALRQCCGDDEQLYKEVQALLKTGVTRETVTVWADAMDTSQLKPGDVVGPYKILEQIGEGGFAIVYLAAQTAPIRRKVALKIIKLGMDTKQVIARFEAERQALAMMDHSCVAKVFDAGATEAGRPYFVMEYVPGDPITDYCDRHRLTTRQRLDLFIQACEAVQHAHQKGIIHRDIKPSNVLVAVKEGQPHVKVIDFGVAKAISQRLTEKTIYTEQGQLIGTPEYMSPEQAEMGALDIDTRSDIYSLGIVLYELLVGALPFDPTTLRQAAFAEIQRIIREQEPPKPSTRLSSLGDASTTLAQKHQSDPRTLIRELRGDLDWITMKALEKDRTRRYETANGLAMDIHRYLLDEPVLAGPPTAAYRVRKFVRRNRVKVAAGFVVALSLLAAAAVSVGFAFSEAEQRRVAAWERDTARAVNEFLLRDLLEAASPTVAQGRPLTVEQVFELAAERVGDRFARRPLVEAQVRETIAEVFGELGRYPEAVQSIRRAYELRHEALGPDDAQTLTTQTKLGVALERSGELEEAERVNAEAVAGLTRRLGPHDRATLWARNALGTTYLAAQKFDEALPIFEDVSARQIEVVGLDNRETVSTLANLAVVLVRMGRLDDAEPAQRKALDAQRRVLGDRHPDTLQSSGNLVGMLYELGRYEEAESIALETLAVAAGIFDENHPALIDLHINLGLTLAALGRASEAVEIVRPALEARIAALGERHPKTINSMNTFCTILMQAGELDEAEQRLRRGAELSAEVFSPGHPYALLFQVNLGGVLLEKGSDSQAVAILADAVPKIAAVLPGRVAGECRIEYGRALAATGELERAQAELLTAHEELLGAGVQEGEGPAGKAALALVELYDAWGKPEKAAEWRAKLPTEQEAVASDKPGQSSSDEKEDE